MARWIALAGTLLALCAGSAVADRGRPRQAADEMRLVFLDADDGGSVHQGARDDGSIDIGRVVARRCGERACMRTVVRHRFRLRVDGGAATRFVSVRAFLQDDSPGQRVRIDGRLVTASPQMIGGATPLGVAVTHTLEIEVPASEPAGLVSHNIVWLVEDAR